MRNDLTDSLLLGVTIGFIALAIHALTVAAAPHYQLLALALAGVVLFAVHLALGLRRGRKSRAETDDRHEHEPAGMRPDRRNPFFRELTKDWTGLDDYPVDGERPLADSARETPAAESANQQRSENK